MARGKRVYVVWVSYTECEWYVGPRNSTTTVGVTTSKDNAQKMFEKWVEKNPKCDCPMLFMTEFNLDDINQ